MDLWFLCITRTIHIFYNGDTACGLRSTRSDVRRRLGAAVAAQGVRRRWDLLARYAAVPTLVLPSTVLTAKHSNSNFSTYGLCLRNHLTFIHVLLHDFMAYAHAVVWRDLSAAWLVARLRRYADPSALTAMIRRSAPSVLC
jgi:hypothetical protein